MRRYVERDLWCYRLEVCTEVGCLHRRLLVGIQWRIVEQLFRERQRRYYGGIALQVLKSRGLDRACRPHRFDRACPSSAATPAAIELACRRGLCDEAAVEGLGEVDVGALELVVEGEQHVGGRFHAGGGNNAGARIDRLVGLDRGEVERLVAEEIIFRHRRGDL